MIIKPHKSNKENLVEILDNSGQAFMLMNLTTCIKKKLTRKISLLAIKNQQNQLLLQRHPKTSSHNAGLWDISIYSHVYAHESCEEAALRELNLQLGIMQTKVKEIASIPYIDHNGARLLAFVFSTSKLTLQEEKIVKNSSSKKESMFIHIHELRNIIEHSQELFTAELFWAVQAGWLD